MESRSTNRRLLFLCTGLNRGGAEMQVFHLAKGLRARGWNAQVLSMLSGGTMADQFREAGIPLHELQMRRGIPDPRAILRLRRAICLLRPDVVHSHMVHANLLARITRIICRMPVLVSTAHSVTEGGRWTEIAYRVTDPMSDLTTIVCNAGAERYVQVGCVPAARLRVVGNGLPVELFRQGVQLRTVTRKQLGMQDEFVWLAVGRFERPKDYFNLINAVKRIGSQHSRFVIAGDGPLRAQTEALAKQLGVANRVRFLGMRKDVPALMTAADGYVMSSAWEGLPMVLLEAAASGLPIVATDVGANREVVRHDISGALVPPSDPAALASALQRLEQLPAETRKAMGMAGRDLVIRNYSLSSVLDQWESIYRSFIQKQHHLALTRHGVIGCRTDHEFFLP